MKKENFAKLLIKECSTKKGTLRKSFVPCLDFIIKEKCYGRRYYLNLKRQMFEMEIFDRLGIDYTTHYDNSVNMSYLLITPKGMRRISPFIKEYNKYVNTTIKKDLFNLCRIIGNFPIKSLQK